MAIDLSSLASVHTFAVAFRERFSKLDVLVNNAAASSPALKITPEGFERDWATNVLGPYLLTTLLVPALRSAVAAGSSASRPARGRPRPLRHPV